MPVSHIFFKTERDYAAITAVSVLCIAASDGTSSIMITDSTSNTPVITVVIADDHIMIRQGIVALLNDQADIAVIGEASNGREAIERVAARHPAIVLMDLSMPLLPGIAAIREIRREFPNTGIVVLSNYEDGAHVREALDAGATGYVTKYSATEDLLSAIRIVASGGIFLAPGLSLTAGGDIKAHILRAQESRVSSLSQREEEVLRLVALGYSNQDIATRISLSIKTVETYKLRSSEKLRLNSRVEILRYARDRGWLEDPSREPAI